MQPPEEGRAGPRWRRTAEKLCAALGNSAGTARGGLGPLPLCPWRMLGQRKDAAERGLQGWGEEASQGERPELAVSPEKRRRSFLAPRTA